MSTEENKALVRRFITQVFENLDPSAVDELVTDDFIMHSVPGATPGARTLKDAMERVRKGLSEVSMRLDDVVAEGDSVAVHLTAHARQTGEFMGLPASNKEYTVPEMHLFLVKNGRIAEQGTHAELLRQHGHYYRLYTQQFRHQLEVQYGVADELLGDDRSNITADSIMIKRERPTEETRAQRKRFHAELRRGQKESHDERRRGTAPLQGVGDRKHAA